MSRQMPTADPVVTPELVKQHGLTSEEFERIKKILGREPNFTELGILPQLAAVRTNNSRKSEVRNSKSEIGGEPPIIHRRRLRNRALRKLRRHPHNRWRDLFR